MLFLVQSIQLDPGEISSSDDAEYLIVLDHREMPNATVVHDAQGFNGVTRR